MLSKSASMTSKQNFFSSCVQILSK
ncbi:TPA: hypothetical protein N0F65_012580 [Lagenidium giganteum]|uniref:Uncharacterized protein n=1 Tax=Lagenidium giganteum TaxID=4803 RepID=A0AAV2YSE7_9STRA|nr:TPA: hypothetical protein N0F65_009144 [Lagenidium giganteum]DAZ96218.1 TPA: hypothetical protein N0F65_012580 [Lagenidium giganteum]